MKNLILLVIVFLVVACSQPNSKLTLSGKPTKETLDEWKRESEMHEEIKNQVYIIRKNMSLRGFLIGEDYNKLIEILKLNEYTVGNMIQIRINEPVQEVFVTLRDGIDKDLLPFKTMFYLSLEREDYDEAELIRMTWIASLTYLKESMGNYLKDYPQIYQKVNLQLNKLQIVGLTDPMLISLRNDLALSLKNKKWDEAQKIQNIITERTKELTALTQAQMPERMVRGPTQTTVIFQQPSKVQVEVMPRYGLSDYARVISIMSGRYLGHREAATLKLFDMLTGR